MEKYIIIAFIVLGTFIFIVSLCKKKSDLFLNLLVRIVLGAAGIYTVNAILTSAGILTGVGLNGSNLFVITILGFPGFVMIYLLSFYYAIF